MSYCPKFYEGLVSLWACSWPFFWGIVELLQNTAELLWSLFCYWSEAFATNKLIQSVSGCCLGCFLNLDPDLLSTFCETNFLEDVSLCLLESAVYTKMLVNTSDGHAGAPVSGCSWITSVFFNIPIAGLLGSFVFLFCIPFLLFIVWLCAFVCACEHACVHMYSCPER